MEKQIKVIFTHFLHKPTQSNEYVNRLTEYLNSLFTGELRERIITQQAYIEHHIDQFNTCTIQAVTNDFNLKGLMQPIIDEGLTALDKASHAKE